MRARQGEIAAAIGATAIIAGILAGCGQPVVPPLPTPTATAAFASDEEALAAAEAAYAAYLEMSDAITSSGGQEPERISRFVTARRLPTELEALDLYAREGLRTVGSLQLEGVVRQEVVLGETSEVHIYACVDASGVRVVNEEGVDVTPPGRADNVTLEVTLVATDGVKFLIDEGAVWTGEEVC